MKEEPTMSRSLKIRKPTASELRRASKILSATDDPQRQRRADVILLYAAGLNARDIAQAIGAHVNTIYSDLRSFDQSGLKCLDRLNQVGAPARITPELEAEIQRLAEIPPYECGLPYGRWSLNKLREHLRKKGLLKKISRERLRQILKKGGSFFGASSARPSAPIRNAKRF
jgi:transposase